MYVDDLLLTAHSADRCAADLDSAEAFFEWLLRVPLLSRISRRARPGNDGPPFVNLEAQTNTYSDSRVVINLIWLSFLYIIYICAGSRGTGGFCDFLRFWIAAQGPGR